MPGGKAMKVQTLDKIEIVTENQLAWLGATGQLKAMSNYPQALPCYDGSKSELRETLKTMPAGWSKPSKDPLEAVDPEDPEGSLIKGTIEKTAEEREILQHLKSIDESLKIIAGVFGQFRVRSLIPFLGTFSM